MIRILVFGESITQGCWDTEGGWVDRLKREAHAKTVASEGATKIQVFNLGISGDTSTKILTRIEGEITARTSEQWQLRVVLCFGVNDSRVTDGVVAVPIEKFRENAREIIAKARRFTNDIIIVGTSPLGKPVVPFKASEYTDASVRTYDDALKEIAETAGIQYIPIRPVFEQETDYPTLFSYDSLHLSDAGHALIAKTVAETLL